LLNGIDERWKRWRRWARHRRPELAERAPSLAISLPWKLLNGIDERWKRWRRWARHRRRELAEGAPPLAVFLPRGLLDGIERWKRRWLRREGERVRGASGFGPQDPARSAGTTEGGPHAALVAKRKIPRKENKALGAARLCFWIGLTGAAIGTGLAIYSDTPEVSLIWGPFLTVSFILCLVAIVQGERRNGTILLIVVILLSAMGTTYYYGTRSEVERAAIDEPSDDQ
jgi:hypothetical protein